MSKKSLMVFAVAGCAILCSRSSAAEYRAICRWLGIGFGPGIHAYHCCPRYVPLRPDAGPSACADCTECAGQMNAEPTEVAKPDEAAPELQPSAGLFGPPPLAISPRQVRHPFSHGASR